MVLIFSNMNNHKAFKMYASGVYRLYEINHTHQYIH